MVAAPSGNPFAKEISIRRRISSIFNKREEDFSTLKEYNDYLEEVEDMTCNLIEGIDVAAIEAKIAKYEEENAEQIMNARAHKAEELAAALKACKGPAHADTEMATDQNAILSTTAQGQYAPAVAGGGLLQPRPLGGHDMNQDDEELMRLRIANGGRAGGWTPEFSRKRALEEAFQSLWM